MTYAVTNSEILKDGMGLIAENRNLKRELEECREMLAAYEAAWLQESRAKRAEEERAKREEEERRQRELLEAIEHVSKLMHKRDDVKDPYIAKIYGREKPRRGKRRTYYYHDRAL